MEVLVCLDLSEISETVFETGLQLAASLGASVTLLHVAAPNPDFVGYQVGPQSVVDARQKELRQEHRLLAKWAEVAGSRVGKVHPLLVQGVTADEIIEHARKLDAHLIVVGSRGRSRIADMLVGSVTQQILHRSQVPVVVVPAIGRSG